MTGRVFVTGVAGFLGSHIAEVFVRAGRRVCGIDNLLGGAKENVPQGVDFVVADCLDREAYAALLTDVELVYHCAAAPWEGLSVFSPYLVHQHTAASTAGVLSAAAAAGVRRFVLCSSMARYGAQASAGVAERVAGLAADCFRYPAGGLAPGQPVRQIAYRQVSGGWRVELPRAALVAVGRRPA